MANRYFVDDWDAVRDCQKEYERCRNAENGREGQCEVCLEETVLFSSGFCDHLYCKNCWTSYIRQ